MPRPLLTVSDLLDQVEQRRVASEGLLEPSSRTKLGQIFTPIATSSFLADLLNLPVSGRFHLLDPGAGVGGLSTAVAARVIASRPELEFRITAFEIDQALHAPLRASLDAIAGVAARHGCDFSYAIETDFIAAGSATASHLLEAEPLHFDACIMNPPYRKLAAKSAERRLLDRVGVQIPNLYAGFLALAAALLDPGGQLSAITPRSFANGAYFESFREFFLKRMALDRIHVFEGRGAVFGHADVLQENVVFSATRDGDRSTVDLSASRGPETQAVPVRTVPYEEVIRPGDELRFVRIPAAEIDTVIAERIQALPATLEDLGVQVSTGRVVDFRAREHLRADPGPDTLPLIYPQHLRFGRVVWPRAGAKKPNALVRGAETESLLFPRGAYALVKRFSAKEERRRVVAGVCAYADLPADDVAFENHLNVFHRDGAGLEDDLAVGLATFLNSTAVDQYVRQFNGHTQINATDLRNLRYPALAELRALGAAANGASDQEAIDDLVAQHVAAIEPAAPETPVGTEG